MQKKNIRIVLTGAPGSGKSTLIQAFSPSSFHIFSEISREIIAESLQNNSEITPWQNLDAFSKKVLTEREKQFHEAKPGINLYDRSLLDVFAYLPEKPELNDAILHTLRYELVFITPPWKEIYTPDSERRESWAECLEADENLRKTYARYGYSLIEVPRLSIDERMNFIRDKISSFVKKNVE